MKKVRVLMIFAIILTVVVVSTKGMEYYECSGETAHDGKKICSVHASYCIDTDNINSLMGDSDCAFLGKVDSVDKVCYDEHKEKMPITYYTVKVIKKVKGEVREGKYIQIQKMGGLVENQYIIPEGDTIPEVGRCYVMFAYTQPDGTLLVSGKNSTKKVFGNEAIASCRLDKYLTASRKQIKTSRKRYQINEKKIDKTNMRGRY